MIHPSQNYDDILSQFTEFSKLTDAELPISLDSYVTKEGYFEVEEYWLSLYKLKSNKFDKLALFMANIMTIPHSNAFVERAFSHVNNIKTDLRNLLEVASVNSIMQVKTFYDYDPKFEPNEDHFECYRTNIKEIQNLRFCMC